MELENTAIRLKKIMHDRNLRQVDLLEMVKPFCTKYNVKINKSDLSQYLSGKVKPGQEKLSMLGMALNVNETWLMGYDVPKEKIHSSENNLSKDEVVLLANYNKLNDLGKNEANKRVSELTEISKYKCDAYECNTFAAHDDDLTDDERKRSLDIAMKAFEEMDKNK